MVSLRFASCYFLPTPNPTVIDHLFERLEANIVYVGNLPLETDVGDLVELFKHAGRIKRVAWYGENREDVPSKVAFIRFHTMIQAMNAKNWDRICYKDSILIVMMICRDQLFNSSVSIVARNIRSDTTDWQLFEAFRKYGKIYGILKPSYGTAYVGFYYEQAAHQALEMHNSMFNGNLIEVKMLQNHVSLQQVNIYDTSNVDVRLLREILVGEDRELDQFYAENNNVGNLTFNNFSNLMLNRRRLSPLHEGNPRQMG
ncbi:hypothetical protein ZHAS_00002896 [Anopheles sinensis]|uniref:RRM domain-containing protein n=1 Tax=Anopheles sinensis TaxID=74873 RepID=A0A084VD95_ANOSI|nr:hypothetical protein ZHAS_00002896 [Anopheles sinensis]